MTPPQNRRHRRHHARPSVQFSDEGIDRRGHPQPWVGLTVTGTSTNLQPDARPQARRRGRGKARGDAREFALSP